MLLKIQCWKDEEIWSSDVEFQQDHRLTRRAFNKLLGMIEDKLCANPELSQARAAASNCRLDAWVQPTLQLSMTLCWLAGGRWQEMRKTHGVSNAYFRRCVWKVIQAIDSVLHIRFPFNNEEELKQISQGFLDISSEGLLQHCVGALDGYVAEIQRPTVAECANPDRYRTRKSEYGINMQAVCDSRRRFLSISVKCPGSVHNSTAWRDGGLAKKIKQNGGMLPKPYYLIGDAAYRGEAGILIPHGGQTNPEQNEAKDAFDFSLSQLRVSMHVRKQVQCARATLACMRAYFAIIPGMVRYSSSVCARVCSDQHRVCIWNAYKEVG